MIIKKSVVEVSKWFVAGIYRDENGMPDYKTEVILTPAFNTMEMADIECRKIRRVIDNHVMFVSSVRRSVKVEVEQRYEPAWDYDYKESKIYDAYAEYLRSEEW